MDYSPFFMKIRAIAFSCMIFTSFLWVILLCLAIFAQWDVLDQPERSLVLVMLVANSITIIVLLILLLCPFRPWLDGARFLFLLISHIGPATTFAFWYPKFSCLTTSADQKGLCGIITLYILITSWVVPVLMIAYVIGLMSFVYHYSKHPLEETTKEKPIGDEEFHIGQPSFSLSSNHISSVGPSPLSIMFPSTSLPTAKRSHLSAGPTSATWSSNSASPDVDTPTTTSPTRLSKPSRTSYY